MDAKFLQKLAQEVLQLRGDRSQRDFAKLIDASQGAVQAWEQGETCPSVDSLAKLAALRGEHVEQFIAYLCDRPFGSQLPLKQQVRGMSLKKLAELNESIAEEISSRVG